MRSTDRNCSGCRFWSEMIAHSGPDTGGQVVAMCLGPDDAPFHGKNTRGTATCGGWKSGHYGAIDSPPNYGEAVRALYDAEDAELAKGGAP